MTQLLEQFLHYIKIERGFSPRTVDAYRHDLLKFIGFLESQGVSEISLVSKDDVRQFMSRLAQDGYQKPNVEITRARKLSAIKSFCKYLTREQIIETNFASDIETPKIPEREPDYLTKDEYDKLLGTVKAIATPYYQFRDIAIVTLLLKTGIRLSELVSLSLNSVDLVQGTIKVIGKGNKERSIPLNEEVVGTLKKYLLSRPEVETSSLFVSRKSNGLSSGSVYHMVKNYLRAANINKEKVGVHSLRHTFGASLIGNGVNLVVIQELLGHKKLETTRKYLHINNVDLRKAVEQISFN